MTPALDNAFDALVSAWRFRWAGFVAACTIALIGWLIVFSLPDRYGAQARVFVDTRTALKPILQGLTVDQDVGAQINYVRQSLLAGPQLERLAVVSGLLPPTISDERQRERILDQMAKRIDFTVSGAGSPGEDRNTAGTIYGIGYLDGNRARALDVVTRLLDSFVDQTLGGKREGSEQAQEFLEAQIKDYEQRLGAAEDSLAEFKKQHVGLMPTEQGGYFSQLQKELDDTKKAESELSVATSRRDELTKQLHGDVAISAAGSVITAPGGQGTSSGVDTLSRIREAQAKLDELLLKFTDKHPDVIAARATLEELKARRESELDNLRHGDAAAAAASGVANNPVYQSIELELNKMDVEIAALRRALAQHQSTVADLRRRLDSAPKVEAEYQQLNRDYDVNKAQYTAMLENYQKARLGERADNAGSVRFEIVLPPTTPVSPVWPKRRQLLAGIWILALIAGVGFAYGLQHLRPVVGSLAALEQLAGFPILGVVSVAFPAQRRAAFRRDVLHFSAAGILLVGALGIALVLSHSGYRLDLTRLQKLVQT